MTPAELLILAVMVAVFIYLWKPFDAPRAPFICEEPGCGGMMDVVRPSEILRSAIVSGVPRDQAMREIATFYATTGVKLIYGCSRCGKMKGLKF